MTYLVNVVTSCSWKIPLLSQPMTFEFHFETTLDDRVSSELSKRTLGQLQNLDHCEYGNLNFSKDRTSVHEQLRCTLPKGVPTIWSGR